VAFRSAVEFLDPDLPVALATLDVDGFGNYNELHGAEAGDQVLAAIEAGIVEGAPPGSIVGHVKGDEWLVVLPDALPEDLLIACDHIRRGIEQRGPLAITAGVAGRPQHGNDFDQLVAAADTGLVRAKESGRNKVAIATDERMVMKSNYYTRPALHRLAKLASRTGHTEAHHLRQALDDHLARHAELL
jgi:diguanylate cyclase (GGDEF)-like protein